MLLQNSSLLHCSRKEMRKEEEKKESDEAEKVRQEAADWDKERERGRRKRAVYHSLMALVESRVQALSLSLSLRRQLLTSAAAQGNPELHLGRKMKRNKRSKDFAVRNQKREKKEEIGMGGGCSERD